MKVKEAIEQRRSIRNFKPDQVSQEDIKKVLEAGRLAPSGTNLQPWRFIIIESEEMRKKLKSYTLNFVAEAPAVIVCCAKLDANQYSQRRIVELHKAGAFKGTELEKMDFSNYKGRQKDEEEVKAYLRLNAAIAIENMALQATELGLGSCWVMMFNQQKVKQLLELDDSLEIVSLLPLGYPQEERSQRPRLELDQLIVDWV
ncbi:nitroreductase family protein [Natroniella sp. ANB-PHB2]|uniref:nitroreductase family protein n=1 Tax=Natroniella sp. ANB-PHB2 TaxID=3384444 RepID=UPI0038D4736C